MTKQQLIEDICRINRSATPEFLSQFEENELSEYLKRLLRIEEPQNQEDQVFTSLLARG